METCLPLEEPQAFPPWQASPTNIREDRSQSSTSNVFSGGMTINNDIQNMAISKEAYQNRAPMDDGLTAHNPHTGCTDLHFLQDLIDKTTQLQ